MKLIISTILLLSLFSCAFAQAARKIDEFGKIYCDDFLARKDDFAFLLYGEPTSIGYILVYEGKYNLRKNETQTQVVLPLIGEAKAYINTMKKRFKVSGFPLERLIFVNAGFRENFTLEFWIVPLGAKPPMPTPKLKKMKHRKGKAGDFCGNL